MPDKAPESNSTRAANFKLQAIKLCQRSIVGKTARSCWVWVWRGISIHVHTHFVVTEREKSLLFRITKPQWHNNFYLYFQYCANMFAIANEMRFFWVTTMITSTMWLPIHCCVVCTVLTVIFLPADVLFRNNRPLPMIGNAIGPSNFSDM